MAVGTERLSGNVARLFVDAAAARRDEPALQSKRHGMVTFGELHDRAMAIAGALQARGLEPEQRVVCMVPMSPALYATVLGTLAAGGVAVFVDPWLSLRAIARLAARAQPAAIVATRKTRLLRLLSRELRRVPISLTPDDAIRAAVAGRFVEMPDDRPALVTYTTGSSGAPKGVNRTHGILAAQHAVIREEFPARPGDVDLTTFPVFALSNLAAGIPTVLPGIDLRRVAEADAASVLRDMEAFGVTTVAASPPLFDRIVRQLRAAGAEAPALRRIVTGGAPVRDDQLRAWREAFPATEIVVAYGSSEAEPVASIGAEERLALTRRAGYCVGRPVAAVRTCVVPIERGPLAAVAPLPRGEVGELLVAGPHVTRDYADGDERAFRDNKVRGADGTVWHRLGDTGRFDDEGRFCLVGRVHSTIHRGGERVDAQLVEQAARGDDARIEQVAALGIDDAALGQRVVVVARSEFDVAEDVRARLAAAGMTADDVVVARAPLPVDPRHNSKVDYERLRGTVAADGLRASRVLTRADPYAARVRAYLAQRFPLFSHVLLIVSYYSSNQFLARELTQPHTPMRYTWRSLVGAITLLCFFFHLRVFDEHKDFADDSRFHPGRLLQRGVVTLGELRRLAYVAIGIEWLLAATAGPAALVALAIAFAFSLLMLKEFFAAAWLKRHFLVYATSHMLLMPLLSLMIWSFSTGRPPWAAPRVFLLYSVVGFFVTFNVEVSRKIRAPHDEVEGLETYSRIFGTYGAAWIVLGLRAVDTSLVMVVGHAIGAPGWFYGALVILFAIMLGTFVRFRLHTTTAAAKAMEINAGLYLIAFDLTLAAALVGQHGFVLP